MKQTLHKTQNYAPWDLQLFSDHKCIKCLFLMASLYSLPASYNSASLFTVDENQNTCGMGLHNK